MPAVHAEEEQEITQEEVLAMILHYRSQTWTLARMHWDQITKAQRDAHREIAERMIDLMHNPQLELASHICLD